MQLRRTIVVVFLAIAVRPADVAGQPPESLPPATQARLELNDGDVVVFTGGTNAVMAQRYAYLETLLTAAHLDRRLRFRNMAWQADTVYRQQRPLNFGDWDQQLGRVGANVVCCWFGQMESLDGPEQIAEFVTAYEQLLDTFLEHADRAVLISPVRFERTADALPDFAVHNRSAEQYSRAIRDLAQRRGATYVDLFSAREQVAERLIENGFRVTPAGFRILAERAARQLGIEVPSASDGESMRRAIVRKNELWFRYWRPMNWAFLAGDRTRQAFSRGPDNEEGSFLQEMEQYLPLIAQAEQQIRAGTPAPPVVELGPEAAGAASPGDDDASDGDDIAEELAAFEMAEGYEINLFASEKDGIPNPIQMRWDPDGRLYVICTPLYPQIQPEETPDDKIVVLEDSDRDGRADRSHVYADSLFMPEGLALGHGGVYLAHRTDLLHLSDADGDGRADQRRVMFTGFGTGDSHQMLNNLTWGPGGALYACQGLHIFSRIETPWGIERLDAAGVWRLRPRRLRLDPFLGNERIPHNPWGILFDDWGQPILWAGNGQGTFWMTAGMVRHSFHLDLPIVWKAPKTTSPEILGGSHLGHDTTDIMLAGDYKSNAVLRVRCDFGEDHASLNLEELSPLVVSSNRAFRPADIKLGPDGAIYIADWYNDVVDHYGVSYRHPDRDKSHGRIWRVTAKGRPVHDWQPLSGEPPTRLLEHLRSRERWALRQATRLLAEMHVETLMPALETWIENLDPNDPQYEQLLLRAIGLYESHEVVAPELLDKLVHASDPRGRAYAARVVGNWGERLAEPLALLEQLVNDPNGRVRLEAVVACSYIRRPRAIEIAAMAIDHPRDPHIDFALLHAVHELKEVWAPVAQVGGLQFDGNQERLRYVLRTEGSREMLTALENWSTLSSSPEALQAMARVGDDEQLGKVFAHPNADAQVLAELAVAFRVRQVMPAGDLTARLGTLLAHSDPATRAAAVRLAGVWGRHEFAEKIATISADSAVNVLIRAAAIESLPAVSRQRASKMLEELAAGDQRGLRPAIIQAMAEIDLAAAADHTAAWLRSSTDQQDGILLLAPLLMHQGGAVALAEALGKTEFSKDEASRCRHVLTAAAITNPSLMLVVNRALGITAQPQEYDLDWIHALATEVNSQGNAERGLVVYKSKILNCSNCHKVGGVGGEIGPDLSSVGRVLPVDRVIEELLWPMRQIKEGFMAIHVITTDGKIHQGIKSNENATELVLRDAISHQDRRIAKSVIDEWVEAGSLMPTALTAGLSRTDLRDLIRYLSELDGYTGQREARNGEEIKAIP